MLSRILLYCCVSFCCLATSYTLANPPHYLPNAVNDLLDNLPEDVNLGVAVTELASGKLIYARHPQRSFIPASTLKWLTSIAALHYLGYNYRFPTTLLAGKHTQVASQWQGDIYVKFSGDPSLTYQGLRHLLHELNKRGVRQLLGTIYLDTSAFEPTTLGSGWMWDDANWCYSAPAAAANLDHNCLQIHLLPGAFPGSHTRIEAKKLTSLTPLTNRVLIAPLGFSDYPVTAQVDNDNHYRIDGYIPWFISHENVELAIHNMPRYISQRLRQALQANGIRFQGEIVVKATPPQAVPIATHYSQPLWALVNHLLATSDNLYAEALFKRMGMGVGHSAGSWQQGRRAMHAYLTHVLAVDISRATIVDGSGMSRYNLLTPALMNQILAKIYYDLPLSRGLLSSLSLDSNGHPYEDLLSPPGVRAKTGSMRSVVGLIGFADNTRLGDLAFTVYVNGFNWPNKYYYTLQKYLAASLS